MSMLVLSNCFERMTEMNMKRAIASTRNRTPMNTMNCPMPIGFERFIP